MPFVRAQLCRCLFCSCFLRLSVSAALFKMLSFAQSRDVQTVYTSAGLQDGGIAEAGHLLVALLLRRPLFSLYELQALFSFICNSLEMYIAMARKSFRNEKINMHGYKSQGQEKIKDAFLPLGTGVTFSHRKQMHAPDFLLLTSTLPPHLTPPPTPFMPRHHRALRAACHVFYMMPSLQTVQ